MNTKRLKRRLIKAIYKKNPVNVDCPDLGIRITAVEKIDKSIIIRYSYREGNPFFGGKKEYVNSIPLWKIVAIYEQLCL